MNYRAELRGFALDRALRLAEANKREATANSTVSLPQLINAADVIADYLYIPDKDIKSHLDSVIPLIVQAGDKQKLNDLILQLQQIEAEWSAGIIETASDLNAEVN